MHRWFKHRSLLVFLPFYALLLLGAESAVRHLWSDYARPADRRVYPDAQVHHDYRPGASFTTHPGPGDDFAPAYNEINALSMRGPLPGTKVGRRILLLGDSFVQADEVAFEQTFGQLLNAHFVQRAEFISHGMVSWSPTPEFSWLYHRGLALQPDDVVLFLCINDFFRISAFHQTDAVYRRQAIYRDGLPVGYRIESPSLAEIALAHSALLQLMRRVYRSATAAWGLADAGDRPSIPGEILHLAQPPDQWPPDLRANVDSTLSVVGAMHDYLRQHRVELHIALVPLPFAWADEAVIGKQHPLYGWSADFAVSQDGIERYARTYAQQRTMGWIDLHAEFARRKEHSAEPLFNGADGHWNTAGHRAVHAALHAYFHSYLPP